jgi:ATP-binding cassette subfamily B (MDR/TAP) protein 1
VFTTPPAARPDVSIFQNFSLTIPAGRQVALVGSSGSGKSTVIQLLERFYDPAGGEIFLDGHNIRTLQLKWLRQQYGWVVGVLGLVYSLPCGAV